MNNNEKGFAQSDVEETFSAIKEHLSSLEPTQVLEVMANVFIWYGASMLKDRPSFSHVNQANLINILIEERKANGESLATAMIQQGLTIFAWLD